MPRAAAKRHAPKARRAAPAKRKSHGGAREGAGRKRDCLPAEVVTRLGNPPKTPAELDAWVRQLLAELLVLQLTGKVSVDLAASIRTTCGEIRRSLPNLPPHADDDDADDLDDEDDGPELEDAADGALRLDS